MSNGNRYITDQVRLYSCVIHQKYPSCIKKAWRFATLFILLILPEERDFGFLPDISQYSP